MMHLSEPIIAFMLMASAGIDDKHRVSILKAATNAISVEKTESDTSKRTSADILQNFQYETVASILRQCVRRDTTKNSDKVLNANQGKFGHGKYSGRKDENLSQMWN